MNHWWAHFLNSKLNVRWLRLLNTFFSPSFGRLLCFNWKMPTSLLCVLCPHKTIFSRQNNLRLLFFRFVHCSRVYVRRWRSFLEFHRKTNTTENNCWRREFDKTFIHCTRLVTKTQKWIEYLKYLNNLSPSISIILFFLAYFIFTREFFSPLWNRNPMISNVFIIWFDLISEGIDWRRERRRRLSKWENFNFNWKSFKLNGIEESYDWDSREFN